MFKGMLTYRISEIWRGILTAFLSLVAVMLLSAVLEVIFGQHTMLSILVRFIRSTANSFFYVSQIMIVVFSFISVRSGFKVGIQNGISRKIIFSTHLLALLGSQIVSFLVGYPMLVFANGFQNIQSIWAPQVILILIAFFWLIIAGALELSSFMTLFDNKLRWFILILVCSLYGLFCYYFQPIIAQISPGFARILTFDLILDFKHGPIDGLLRLSRQPINLMIIIENIVIPLVIAGICQHLMQTRLLSISLRRKTN